MTLDPVPSGWSGADRWSVGADAGGGDPVPRPAPLRPLTAADILDGAFAVLKARPRTVVGIAAAFVVPVQLLVAYLQRDILDGAGFIETFNDPTLADAAADSDQGSAAASVVALLGPSLMLPFVAGALGRLVAAWYAGSDLDAGTALKAAGRRWWALLASWVVVHLLEAVGLLLLGFPALLVMTVFVVTAPAVVVEGLGPVAGLRRSWRLTTRRFWPTMGVALLSGLVVYVLGQALALLPTVIAFVIGLDVGWVILAVAGAAVGLVTTPVVAAATVLLYLDLRVRTEGLDLELAAAQHFDRGP